MSDRCMCGGKIIKKPKGDYVLIACKECGEVFYVMEREMWIDKNGNTYTNSEVVEVDIDTPGPQFLGVVTVASKRKSNCINNWVEVVRIK